MGTGDVAEPRRMDLQDGQLVEEIGLERLLTHAGLPRCGRRARRSSLWSRSVSRQHRAGHVGHVKLPGGVVLDDTRKGGFVSAALPSRRAPVAQWIEQW